MKFNRFIRYSQVFAPKAQTKTLFLIRSDYLLRSYKTLPLLMTKYNTETSGVLAYGTDGEENMVTGFRRRKAFSLRYSPDGPFEKKTTRIWNYRKRGHRIEIVSDIFGKVLGEVTEGGLVDCTSSKDFDIALNNVTSKWPGLHRNGDKFTAYFLKEKAEVIHESATADIR